MKYMYLVCSILSFSVALFSWYKYSDENDVLESKKRLLEKTEKLSALVEKNAVFLKEHSGFAEVKNANELKMELIRISEEAGINDISISDAHLDKNKKTSIPLYKFIIAAKARDEKSVYKFIFLLENILSGIVSIDSFEMSFDNKAKISITVYSANCIKKKIIKDTKCMISKDYNQCDLHLFNTDLCKTYKLCGIINNTAFIRISDEKKKCKNVECIIGDKLGIYTIKEINEFNIVIEEECGMIKTIDLGVEF